MYQVWVKINNNICEEVKNSKNKMIQILHIFEMNFRELLHNCIHVVN